MSTESPSPPNTIAPQIPERSNILLLTPALSPADDEACIDLLTITEPTEEDVLSITFTDAPDERLELWQSYVDDLPAEAAIVSVGMATRSTAMTDAPRQQIPSPITVESVSDPDDLTGLGLTISEFLSTWSGGPNRTVVCFHSITPLLDHVDLEEVFRFLHVLLSRLELVDAVAHFHMDPTAHDEETINTLSPLFDVVVHHSDDEGYTVV